MFYSFKNHLTIKFTVLEKIRKLKFTVNKRKKENHILQF